MHITLAEAPQFKMTLSLADETVLKASPMLRPPTDIFLISVSVRKAGV
jgi:hypothetical protein